MATANSMELALRIRADLAQAKTALRELETGLGRVGTTAGQTGDALGDIDTSGLEAAGTAAAQTSRQTEQAGETAGEAAERIRAMVQASLEQQRAWQEQVAVEQAVFDASRQNVEAEAERAAAYRKTVEAARESQQVISGQMQSYSELFDVVQHGIRSLEHLAEVERQLDQAVEHGAVMEAEQIEILKVLEREERRLLAAREKQERQMRSLLGTYDPASAALAKLTADEAKLKRAVDEGRISREQYNRAMVGVAAQRAQWQTLSEGVDNATDKMKNLNVTAREVRNSLASVSTQLTRGDVDGAGNTLLRLGSRSAIGAAGTAGIAGTATAIAGVASAIGLVAVAAYRGRQEIRAVENTLVMTGNAAGVTAAEISDMATRMDALDGVTYSRALSTLNVVADSSKFAGEQLELVATAAEQMRVATGKSIQDTIAEFDAIRRDPVAALLELNRQYRFLTREQLDNIETLKEQGRETEAVTEAMRIHADMIATRTPQITDNLGWIESAWRSIRQTAAEAWDAMLGIGRQHTAATATAQIERLQSRLASTPTWDIDNRQQVMTEISNLEKLVADLEARTESAADAAAEVVDSDAEDARRKAQADWQRQTERHLSDRVKMENEINEVRQLGLAAGRSEAEIEAQIAAIRKTYADRAVRGSRGGRTEAQQAEDAARRELENLQRQVAMLDLLEDGETRVSEAARVRYETTEGALRNASAGTRQQLLEQAQLLDTERQRADAVKRLVDVHLEIARLQGRGEDAAIARTRQELEKLQQTLTEMGRTADAANVSKLLDLQGASTELQQLQVDYRRTMDQIASDQQRIQLELQAGLITEADAQQRIVNLYRDKLGTLREMVPQMRAAAEALGDPAALANVAEIELRLQEMANVTNLLQQHVRSTFQGAFRDGLMSLATATDSLTDAVGNFFVSVAQGMAEFVAQDWAQQLTNQLMSKFGHLLGDTADTASETAAATAAASITTTAAATAAATTTGAATTAAGTIAVGAAAVKTSSDELTTAGGTLLTGAGAISLAARELQAAAASMMAANGMGAAVGFYEGGYTGPGGKYQYAGPVHKGEGVLNQREIRALGGPRGFFALRRAIAAGTLPKLNAPAVQVPTAPRYSFAEGGYARDAMPAAPSVNIQNNVLFDPEAVAQQVTSTRTFNRRVVQVVGGNRDAIQGEWH